MCFIGPTKNNERLNSIWRAKPTKCLGFSANNPFEIENELEADVIIQVEPMMTQDNSKLGTYVLNLKSWD